MRMYKVGILYITIHTELRLSFAFHSASPRGEEKKTYKKGDLLDVYIVIFMLMMPF